MLRSLVGSEMCIRDSPGTGFSRYPCQRRWRPQQCPVVPRRCTRCSTRRPCLICRGFPPYTTSESSTTVRRPECCRVSSRWVGSHCRTCARRTHWRPRRPRSSRWHRRELRRGRYATSTLAGRLHSICAKCLFPPCTFDNLRCDNACFELHYTVVFGLSSKFSSTVLMLYIIQQTRMH